MTKDLSALFCPKSIALIGASRTPEKVGGIVLKNILNSGFQGKIYPVNPNAGDINGLQCFPDINSIPEVPDLAVVALPSNLIMPTVNQLGEKGVKNAVVFAAGFKETGGEGAKLEKELIDTANKYNINILGPNCLGFVNNTCPANVTFGQLVNQKGNLRFISQSGAIAASIFDWCRAVGLGFAEFITLGNKAVINENDVLEYFSSHPQNYTEDGLSGVSPIGMYLESISKGEEFLRLTDHISTKDPVFIIKPGKTHAAAQAMQSHTGAIAGEDAVLETALKQSGVVRCETLEDFFDFSRAFAWENAPVGPGVAVVSNAGGPAVISADAVIEEGLELAELDGQTKERLQSVLPHAASLYNPVDVLGDALADRFAQAADILLQQENVHSLLVILTPQIMTQIDKTAEAIGDLSKKYQKPILCSFIGGTLIAEGERKLNEYRIPSFRFPERAIKALSVMWLWNKEKSKNEKTGEAQQTTPLLDENRLKEIINEAINSNQKTLDNFEANGLMEASGIPVPPTTIAANVGEANVFAQNNGWPIVLKLSAPGLLHKKDIGGVVTDIWNENQLNEAWTALEYKVSQLEDEVKNNVKFQAQKDIVKGIEVIVGVKRDPTFGPVLLFGAGGTWTEVLEDRNLRLLPVDTERAKKLVEESKIFTILKGSRGEPPYALDKLYDIIVRLGMLAQSQQDISEIEINPVIVTLNDVWAVDAKVVLSQGVSVPVKGPQFKVANTLAHSILAGTYHYFEFESESPLIYQPGQYISVKVAPNRINCYSVAGHTNNNTFNLLVDTSPGGPGSKFFENLKVGDKITYLGPFGNLILNENDGANHLLFLGTGSGCAPLKVLIESALKGKNIQTPISYYFGLRNPQDVFWKDHFEQLSREHPNFSFKLVLSKPDENWNGDSGHITDFIERNFPDASGLSVYLCGNKKMIEEATNILASHGCPKERIYSEKF
jgi:acetate---CoA ligase (ADP-forming)